MDQSGCQIDHSTAAELSADEKHAIGHRGRASRALAPFLTRILADSDGRFFG